MDSVESLAKHVCKIWLWSRQLQSARFEHIFDMIGSRCASRVQGTYNSPCDSTIVIDEGVPHKQPTFAQRSKVTLPSLPLVPHWWMVTWIKRNSALVCSCYFHMCPGGGKIRRIGFIPLQRNLGDSLLPLPSAVSAASQIKLYETYNGTQNLYFLLEPHFQPFLWSFDEFCIPSGVFGTF